MKTEAFDPAKYLTTEQSRSELLREARKSENARFIMIAEAAVDRARERYGLISIEQGGKP